jgi:nitrogen fixation/metabolism regulation signal transduction histidine kinase
MSQAATAPAAGSGRHQRRMKNYLLDRHFQLKYAGYMVALTVVLSLSLGLILWRTSLAVIAQSHEAVRQGEQVVSIGREVLDESKKVNAVVQMNIVKDPYYNDNPDLLAAFQSDAKDQDARLLGQQRALEKQATALRKHSTNLEDRYQAMLVTLCLVLLLFVVAIGFAGIVITHKVAGPIYKMKRQIRDLGEGHMKLPGKLRKGDELVDFFDTFEHTVRNLRRRQEEEIKKLDSAIAVLDGKAAPEALAPLHSLRAEMQAALD